MRMCAAFAVGVASCACACAPVVARHSGGTDRYGCHNGPTGNHCHNEGDGGGGGGNGGGGLSDGAAVALGLLAVAGVVGVMALIVANSDAPSSPEPESRAFHPVVPFADGTCPPEAPVKRFPSGDIWRFAAPRDPGYAQVFAEWCDRTPEEARAQGAWPFVGSKGQTP